MNAISGKRCAVTGAGGFIGKAVCRRLSAEGAFVAGLDSNQAARATVEDAGAQFTHCDVTDAAAVRRSLTHAELVVHTAAVVTDWGNMKDFVAVNVRGTRNVLDAAAALDVERLVHLSSVVTWGFEHAHELHEDAPHRTMGIPYIDTKASSDTLARGRAKRGEPITVIRPGDVYGPGSTPWSVRPLEAIKQRQFVLVGQGRGLLLPIYIDDLVEALLLALTVPGAKGTALTVWDGHAVTCEQFFGYYARMLGRKRIPKVPGPIAELAALPQEVLAKLTGRPPAFTRNAITFVSRRAPLSNRRAREVLDWEPKVSLDEGMRRTERWFHEQGLL